jgi:hypothetical protein
LDLHTKYFCSCNGTVWNFFSFYSSSLRIQIHFFMKDCKFIVCQILKNFLTLQIIEQADHLSKKKCHRRWCLFQKTENLSRRGNLSMRRHHQVLNFLLYILLRYMPLRTVIFVLVVNMFLVWLLSNVCTKQSVAHRWWSKFF